MVAGSLVSSYAQRVIAFRLTLNIRGRARREHAARDLVNDSGVAADTGNVKRAAASQVVAKTGLLCRLSVCNWNISLGGTYGTLRDLT